MDYSTGKLAFILIAAVVLAALGSWLLAWRYRSAMRRLMSLPVGVGREPDPAAASRAVPKTNAARVDDVSDGRPHRPIGLADNQRAAWQLTIALVVLSMLIALSASVLQHRVMFPAEPLPWKRISVLTFVHLWPAVPALGVVWRWSRWRIAALLGLWVVLCFAIIQWRSVESMPLQSLAFLGFEIGPPLLLIALLLLGDATRAIAPWLLPPLLRGFQAHNAGCLHELSVLSRQTRLQRVVVLADAVTDRAAAAQAVAGAVAERFVWIDASRIGSRLVRDVLQQLFVPPASGELPRAQTAAVR